MNRETSTNRNQREEENIRDVEELDLSDLVV